MSQLLTVGQLARRAGLSRSTLLHYEGLGLLSAAARSRAGYRLYGEREVERLELIRSYREAGLPMASIAQLLGGGGGSAARILEQHLVALNRSIARLREQQRRVARLLGQPRLLATSRVMTKQRWVALLRKTGLDDDAMARWHSVFEAEAPEAHQDFLESLSIPAEEITAIRVASRGAGSGSPSPATSSTRRTSSIARGTSSPRR